MLETKNEVGSSGVSTNTARAVARGKPADLEEYQRLEAPLVRIASEGDQCRVIGKVFNHSTLYWDVISPAGDGLVARRVSKARSHIVTCTDCPSVDQSD